MKPRDSQLRSKQFEVETLRHQLALFDRTIADLRTIHAELDRQIEAEERRTGVRDRSHFAYSTVARAARERRAKLDTSLADLVGRRAVTEADLDAATATLESLKEAARTEPAGEPEAVGTDETAAPALQRLRCA